MTPRHAVGEEREKSRAIGGAANTETNMRINDCSSYPIGAAQINAAHDQAHQAARAMAIGAF